MAALRACDDGLERAPLVAGVALDGLDQVGDEVERRFSCTSIWAQAFSTRLRSLTRPLYVATRYSSSRTMMTTMTISAIPMGLLVWMRSDDREVYGVAAAKSAQRGRRGRPVAGRAAAR